MSKDRFRIQGLANPRHEGLKIGKWVTAASDRLFHSFDERAADHNGIGVLRHGLGRGRIRNAKPHADGHGGVATNHRHTIGHCIDIKGGRPRDALKGDVIQIARAESSDLTHSRLGRRWCEQKDHIEPSLVAGQAKGLALLGGVVHHQDTIDAAGRGGPDKIRAAILLNRIGIAHEDNRRGGVGLAKIGHPIEAVLKAHAPGQRPLA